MYSTVSVDLAICSSYTYGLLPMLGCTGFVPLQAEALAMSTEFNRELKSFLRLNIISFYTTTVEFHSPFPPLLFIDLKTITSFQNGNLKTYYSKE